MKNHTTAIDVDVLLRQTHWLRQLAISLLRDPHQAEDALQETLLTALERPPGKVASEFKLRGWLAQVLRSKAFNAMRAERRRSERQRLAARHEALPPVSDAMERVAVQRDLVQAVLALEQPQREAIVLHYFDGLAPREIAARVGASPGAIRTRLTRGREQLRARLDAACNGERERWVLPLVALVPQEANSAVVTVATGALLAKLWWLVAATVALGLGWWILASRGPAPGSTGLEMAVAPTAAESARLAAAEPSGPAKDAGALAEEHRVSVEEPAPRDAEPLPLPVDDTVVVTARVVDEDGRPLADVAMSVYVLPHLALALSVARSDEEGELRLELPWKDGLDICLPQPCSFTLRGEGRATTSTRRHLVAGERAFLGTIPMGPGGGVAGRVVDDRSRPVAGAIVGVVPPLSEWDEAQTDWLYALGRGGVGPTAVVTGSDGSYLIEGAPARHVSVEAKADRFFHGYSPSLLIEAGSVVTADDIALEPAGREHWIEGMVLSEAGAPVARETVALLTADGESIYGLTRTSEEGTFHITVLPDRAYTLTAGRRGHAWLEREGVRAGATDIVLQFHTPDLGSFRALVVGGGDRPLRDVWGMVTCAEDRYLRGGDSYEYEPGAIELLLPDDPFLVRVGAFGCKTQRQGPFDPTNMPEEVVFTLEPVSGITGRVTAAGAPVTGARLDLHLGLPGGEQWGEGHPGTFVRIAPFILGRATTLEDGRFFLAVSPGIGHAYDTDELYLHAFADGLAYAERGPFSLATLDEVGEFETEIELVPGGSLTGRIVGPGDFEPRGRRVVLSRGDGHFHSQVVNERGGFHFTDLPPGGYALHRDEDGELSRMREKTGRWFRPWEGEVPWSLEIAAGRETRFDLVVERAPSCQIAGRFTLNGAAPVGWTGSLIGESGSWPVEASGEFAAEVERIGRCRLGFSSPASSRVFSRFTADLDLPEGELFWERDVPVGSLELLGLQLDEPSRVRLEGVMDTDGLYSLTWTGGTELEWVAMIHHATDGRLRLPQVPAGLVHLTHAASDLELDIQLHAGENKLVDLSQ